MRKRIVDQLGLTYYRLTREELQRIESRAASQAAMLRAAGTNVVLTCRVEHVTPQSELSGLIKFRRKITFEIRTFYDAEDLRRQQGDPKHLCSPVHEVKASVSHRLGR